MSEPVLVTGSTGFVGAALCRHLVQAGCNVRAAVRDPHKFSAPGTQPVVVGNLASNTDWRAAVEGVRAVVHCAARVHVMRETASDPLAEFRRVNVAGTLNLARQAADAGVRRIVFISTIGVNGAETQPGRPFTAEDTPAPHSPYSVSKYEAEQALQELARSRSIEVVVIRPPLVFGPGAPGNFERLMRALHQGIPLPFGALDNRRSFVALGNLTSLIYTCIDHPKAANRTFMVSDGEDISTTELLRGVARGLGRPARLIPVPGAAIRWVARMAGKADFAQRLCGSLQVDISATRSLLGWAPPVRLAQALDEAAREFLAPSRTA